MGERTASEVAQRAAAPEAASATTLAAPLVARPFQSLSRPVSGRAMVLRLASTGAGAKSSFAAAWQRECDYGTPFLFVPVALGAGAWTWYALPRDLPPLLLTAMLVATAILAVRWWHRGGVHSVAARTGFLFVAGLTLAAIETAYAKMRIFRVPELLTTAFGLGVLAVVARYLVG